MNDELIKRIDAWFKHMGSWNNTWHLLEDCRAELTKKYVPMTDDELDKLSAQWEGEPSDGTEPYCWDRYIETQVIRRAGLEVRSER